ncbi:MAG TPA: galactokinase, partial [Clostridiales bacterium]|nr:galactokinase [Clostridiales bacterium]
MDYARYYGDNYDEERLGKRFSSLSAAFTENEGFAPERFFSSPGRAEILGNHTDHNHGLVLVAAISCDILAAVAKRDDGKVKICSEGYSPFTVDLSDLSVSPKEKGTSVALTRGVARAIKDRGFDIGGFTAYLTSDVFRGAGVSSSAAYEVLISEIFNSLYLGGRLSAVDKAVISQYAENVYFGKPCGLLDQSGIAIGSLSRLDFKVPTSPVIEKYSMIEGYTLVITNTGGDHAALTPHYAAIRSEMEEIAGYFGEKVLRDVPYVKYRDALPELMKKYSGRAVLRALHFYEENERVDEACAALSENDAQKFLKAVNDSGF